MTGFDGDDRDEDCCSGCGVRMDVIGPPGPRHKSGCPEVPPPGPPERNLTDDEFEYLMSFSPLPETAEEQRILLEARCTGRSVRPPRRGWTFGDKP